ncbi:hypothetical protein AB0M41_35305 [Streptomyces sp. NPDC051896]|uniref:hypothetical protein n=1 Tax=Streptomyces sp. NPDC051896 TaxID=3155416 RepID=UPI003430D257
METVTQFNKGDRVEYKGQDNQKHTGEIRRIQGESPQARYTVRDEKTKSEEQVEERKIERSL